MLDYASEDFVFQFHGEELKANIVAISYEKGFYETHANLNSLPKVIQVKITLLESYEKSILNKEFNFPCKAPSDMEPEFKANLNRLAGRFAVQWFATHNGLGKAMLDKAVQMDTAKKYNVTEISNDVTAYLDPSFVGYSHSFSESAGVKIDDAVSKMTNFLNSDYEDLTNAELCDLMEGKTIQVTMCCESRAPSQIKIDLKL